MGFPGVIGLGLPGYQEMLVLLVVGLLIFGRRLPEVGRKLGQTVVQLRKGLQDFKDQIRDDESLQEAKSSVHDIKKAVDVPRNIANPKRMLEAVARDAIDEADQTIAREREAETEIDPEVEDAERNRE